MGISIVIPVYNSEQSLLPLLTQLKTVLTGLGQPFEVLLVNDASRDRSWEVISGALAQFPWVIGINFMRNYGQHNALLAGIRKARYDIVVTMDDDLQNPPEEIPRLLASLDAGYDVVYGAPEQEKHGLWRDLASQITKLVLQSAMGVATARRVSAFRAFRTPVRDAFADYRNPSVNIDVLLTWGTNRFTAITVRHDKRKAGASNYTCRKLIAHALNMMTGFSTMPLQLASVIGFLFMIFGSLILAFVLFTYLTRGGVVPGFTFLASIIAVFSGVQLFSLGIIGEYLARMHLRSMERPPYVIRQTTPETSRASTP
jgi:undecaprenyl-phosphate 4-deoxy-4-formamido-L-arabinose transferase